MEILVARQPIFDRNDAVAAYELLYRDRLSVAAGVAGSAAPAAPADSAEQLVLNAAVGIGLDELAGTVPAFVSASPDLLVGRAFELFDPQRIVVQVLTSDARDPSLRAAVEDLYVAGYHLALDGYEGESEESLLQFFEYAKVDITAPPPPQLGPAAAALRRRGIRLIAENVPNRTVRDACVHAGIELFQGYLFSRPETIKKRDLSIEHVRTFQLMRMVRDVDNSEIQIENEFRADVSLTYKLLKIVNSAAVGGRGVRSIAHAIRLLGRDALYRWLGLLLMAHSSDGGVEQEIIRTALVRARWCELLADAGSRPLAGGSLYIVGLLSLMDTLLGTPMDELVGQMDLAPEVRAALLNRGGQFGQVLRIAERYEEGEWDDVLELASNVGIPQPEVGRLYLEAVRWAKERADEM